MSSISKLWKRQAVEFDGIYSGFLLNERQADQILEFIRDFSGRETLVVVDPVLGDNGKRYDIFDSQMELAAGRLAEQAHVITPNLTEALLLGRHQTGRRSVLWDGRKRLRWPKTWRRF